MTTTTNLTPDDIADAQSVLDEANWDARDELTPYMKEDELAAQYESRR